MLRPVNKTVPEREGPDKALTSMSHGNLSTTWCVKRTPGLGGCISCRACCILLA